MKNAPNETWKEKAGGDSRQPPAQSNLPVRLLLGLEGTDFVAVTLGSQSLAGLFLGELALVVLHGDGGRQCITIELNLGHAGQG